MQSRNHVARALGTLAPLAWILAGCASAPPQSGMSQLTEVEEGARPEALATRVMEFTDKLAAVVESTADDIALAADDAAVGSATLRWKAYAIPSADKAGFRSDPMAALLDLWALCKQMALYFEQGEGRAAFGEHQEVAIAAARQLLREIEDVARTVLHEEGFASVQERIADWSELHPIEGAAFVRESPTAELADFTRAAAGGLQSIASSIASVELMLADVAARSRIYLAHLPKQARWQAELVIDETLPRDAVPRLVAAAESAAASMGEIDRVVVALPPFLERMIGLVLETLAAERATVIAEVRAEREAVLAAVDAEREAIFAGIRSEREAVLEALEAQRRAVLEDLDRQRAETLAFVAAERDAVVAELRGERATILNAAGDLAKQVVDVAAPRIDATVDRAALRALQLLGVLLLAYPLLVWIAARIRRPRRSAT